MAIRIITDTGCDLTAQQAQDMNIFLVPMTVRFGDTEYHPGFDLTSHDFYEKLTSSNILPTTSQPTPFDFETIYRTVYQQGDQAVAICVSSVLSGTYQSACIAAEEFFNCIYVVDSKSVSIGQRLLLERAICLQSTCQDAAALAAALEEEAKYIQLIGAVETLDYLVKGGRLSKAAGIAGTALGIRPILQLKNGSLQVIGKARGARNANAMITSYAVKGGIDTSLPVIVGYTGNDLSVLKTYIESCNNLWNTDNALPHAAIGGTIGAHAGPGMIAVSFFQNRNN